MDKFLEDWFKQFEINQPTINQLIDEDKATLVYDVPGLSKGDFNISVEDDMIIINAENDKRSFSKKLRIITKNWDIANIEATVKHGVLTIVIPRSEKQITEIKVK